MNIPHKMTSPKRNGKWNGVRRASGLAAGLGLLLTAPIYADSPYSMAPPIEAGYSSASGVTSPDSVFNWTEVPQDEQVPIRRAVFDQGGYQLYDRSGETIVVPFTDQNLYVMKFGESTDGTMYFVNEGGTPVLYVPRNGYLENAAVPGARWYPFSEQFHPSHPVFLGIAPSWHVFLGMGWYSGMYCHGGYWHETPYFAGSVFFPSFGLSFEIGGHHYDGWDRYHDYYDRHPAPYRVTVVNNYIYDRASRPDWGGRPFQGGGPRNGNSPSFGSHTYGQGRSYPNNQGSYPADRGSYPIDRPLSGGRVFQGAPRSDGAGRAGQTYGNGGPAFGSAGHTFGGSRSNNTGDRTFGGRPLTETRPFGGTPSGSAPSSSTGDRTFGGNPTFGGSRPAPSSGGDHTFSSGDHSFSGGIGRPSYRSSTGGGSGSDRTFGGSRPSSGSQPSGADHAGNSGGRANSGGDRTNSGGVGRTNSSVGDHAVSGSGQPFGGGGRPFSGRPR